MKMYRQSTQTPNNIIVIAIDPGYDRMGVAIIERDKTRKEKILFSDCLLSDKKNDFYVRLGSLGQRLQEIISKWNPTHLAFEKLFFAKNQKTALSVAEVRGMIGYIAHTNNLLIREYTPMQVKNAITGYGRADKKQLAQMVCAITKNSKKIRYDDEYDAIAIGLTCTASEK